MRRERAGGEPRHDRVPALERLTARARRPSFQGRRSRRSVRRRSKWFRRSAPSRRSPSPLTPSARRRRTAVRRRTAGRRTRPVVWSCRWYAPEPPVPQTFSRRGDRPGPGAPPSAGRHVFRGGGQSPVSGAAAFCRDTRRTGMDGAEADSGRARCCGSGRHAREQDPPQGSWPTGAGGRSPEETAALLEELARRRFSGRCSTACSAATSWTTAAAAAAAAAATSDGCSARLCGPADGDPLFRPLPVAGVGGAVLVSADRHRRPGRTRRHAAASVGARDGRPGPGREDRPTGRPRVCAGHLPPMASDQPQDVPGAARPRPASQEWTAAPEAQGALERLQRAASARTDWIGTAFDDSGRRVLVVFDRGTSL